jgi:hypothetical protein
MNEKWTLPVAFGEKLALHGSTNTGDNSSTGTINVDGDRLQDSLNTYFPCKLLYCGNSAMSIGASEMDRMLKAFNGSGTKVALVGYADTFAMAIRTEI